MHWPRRPRGHRVWVLRLLKVAGLEWWGELRRHGRTLGESERPGARWSIHGRWRGRV